MVSPHDDRCGLKKNQNAPRPSEHPPVMGGKWQLYLPCDFIIIQALLHSFKTGAVLPCRFKTMILQHRSIDVSMVITYSKSMDQPGKVANPARGQLNREN